MLIFMRRSNLEGTHVEGMIYGFLGDCIIRVG